MSGVRRGVLAVLAVLAVATAACTTDQDGETGSAVGTGGLTIVATTTIWGDVVSNIVGDDAQVEVLIPVGADTHGFEASSRQVALIQEADLVVANGLGLEEGLEDALDAARTDGANVLEVAAMLDPIPFGQHGDEQGEDDATSFDPHVWTDPLRVAQGGRLIATELHRLAPDVDWLGRADMYADALTELDASIIDTLEAVPVPERKMVTNHDAFGYFASRYGFEIVGVVIPGGSTLADPSSAELAELVEVMRTDDINVIFTETTTPSVLADAVAGELGESVQNVELYTGSLDEPGSDADTVIGMLRTNAARVANALR